MTGSFDHPLGHIEDQQRKEKLILEFSGLIIARHGGSVLGHAHDIITIFEAYPKVDPITLLEKVIEDLRNPDKRSTPYWVLLTERVREELAKQGLSINGQ